jgi:PKD repeat protein
VGDTFTYAWDFGDNTASTSSAVSHTFPAAGTYVVKLIVTDGWGAPSVQATKSITVP